MVPGTTLGDHGSSSSLLQQEVQAGSSAVEQFWIGSWSLRMSLRRLWVMLCPEKGAPCPPPSRESTWVDSSCKQALGQQLQAFPTSVPCGGGCTGLSQNPGEVCTQNLGLSLFWVPPYFSSSCDCPKLFGFSDQKRLWGSSHPTEGQCQPARRPRASWKPHPHAA